MKLSLRRAVGSLYIVLIMAVIVMTVVHRTKEVYCSGTSVVATVTDTTGDEGMTQLFS